MARARNIKPGMYKNEDLAECSVWARYIFPGLWMLADREGRLEDRPKRIKGELLPFDAQDVEPLLRELQARGFIERYQIEGASFIQVSKFKDHQSPHYSEKASVIKGAPLPEMKPHIRASNSRKRVVIKKGSQPPDSLIADSLIPSSLIPDTGFSDSPNPDKGNSVVTEPRSDHSPKTAPVWRAYSEAYQRRWGVEPTRNATVNGQLAHFVTRVPQADGPSIAAFYVTHNKAFYVGQKHPVGLLLRDAEGLRTEWLSGVQVTDGKAREADRKQTQGEVWKKLIEEANESGAH